jgi:hypothetical protein
MDSEPSAAAQTKRIAESDDIDAAVIAAGADYLACGDGDSGCGEAYRQVFKVHCGGGRLRRRAEAGEALLARFDHATRADSNEIRGQETGGFLRGLRMQPMVFYAKDGLGGSLGLRPRLCCCVEKRCNRENQAGHQTEDDPLQPQILMKIFLR